MTCRSICTATALGKHGIVPAIPATRVIDYPEHQVTHLYHVRSDASRICQGDTVVVCHRNGVVSNAPHTTVMPDGTEIPTTFSMPFGRFVGIHNGVAWIAWDGMDYTATLNEFDNATI